MSKALILDRDGTLIVKHHYLSDPAKVELLPGVRETLHRFLERGFRLFLFTNQSAVGRGLFGLDTVERCNARMLELLQLPAPGFTEVCIAPETPEMPAVYRKPSPRFILEMVAKYSLDPRETWMIGDMPSDVQAGVNAGVRSIWLRPEPEATASDYLWHCPDMVAFEERWLELQREAQSLAAV